MLAHLRRRERLHEGAHARTWRLLQEQIFEEIKSRTQETDLGVPAPRGRLVVLRPHGRGTAVRHPLPRARRASPDDWDTARRSPEDASPLPGEQVLLDDNVEAEGARVLLARQLRRHGRRPHHALRASTSRATSATRIRLRDLADRAETFADEIPEHRRGRVLRPERPLRLLRDRRRRLAPRHRLAARGRHAGIRRRDGLPRARRALLGGRRPHPQPPVPRDRGRVERHERDRGCSTPPTRRASSRVVWPRGDGVEYDVEHASSAARDRC